MMAARNRSNLYSRVGMVLLTTLLTTGFVTKSADAVDFVGTVDFQGDVIFSAPIAGISLEDLSISVKTETQATGQATKCEITGTTDDNADVAGNYPDTGSVDASYLVERGGPNLPEGACVTTLVATRRP